jgi:methylmalonyl-CoA mutase cobalamin-binding subunit
LNRRAEELGRPSIPVTIAGIRPDAGRIERLEQMGVHRVFFWLPSEREAVGAAIEDCIAAIDDYQRAGG